jgi:hypothetical protein
MTAGVEACLDRARVSTRNLVNDSPQGLVGYLYHHVQVIGHPAIGMNVSGIPDRHMRNNFVEQRAVLLGEKDRKTVVPA